MECVVFLANCWRIKVPKEVVSFTLIANNQRNRISATTWWIRMVKKFEKTANHWLWKKRSYLRNALGYFRRWSLSPLKLFVDRAKKLLSPTVKNCLQDDRICETQSFHIYSNLNKQWDHSKNRFRTERSIHKKKSVQKNVLDVDMFWNLKWWYGLEMTEWRKTCCKTAV